MNKLVTAIILGVWTLLTFGGGMMLYPKLYPQPELVVNPTPVTIQVPEPELRTPDEIWDNVVSPHGGTNIELPFEIISSVTDTGSMEPTINGESKIILREEPVGIGDIVVFDNGTLWAHRIIGDLGDKWIMKGDAQKQLEFVPKDRVLYRVVGIIY